MAVSFARGSLNLANWGFGAGDIAVIAGAGRSVGTWLLANAKDRGLFEFLKVDKENVILRTGLIDVGQLHKRWDTKLVLLKNGRRFEMHTPHKIRGVVVENMDSFTWLMSLITASLDTVLTWRDLLSVVTDFMLNIFQEATSGLDYVRHEVVHHIQGWQSAASVRGISLKARETWELLAAKNMHWPGMIPSNDRGELLRLLIWIVAGGKTDLHFFTTSGDIYCFAIILQELGVELLTDTEVAGSCFHGGRIHVVKSRHAAPPENEKQQAVRRRGMRVPLDAMEECISLWPGGRRVTNDLRLIFEDGMKICSEDQLQFIPFYNSDNPYQITGSPCDEEDADLNYQISFKSEKSLPRVSSGSDKIYRNILPVESPSAVRGLLQICHQWPAESYELLAAFFESDYSSDGRHNLSPDLDDYVAQVQSFVLGYYYALLRPLINSSQLSINEACGGWRWYDMEFFQLIKDFVRSRHHRKIQKGKTNVYMFFRSNVLKLAAFLFAAVDLDSLRSVKQGTLGVIGKLSIVNSSVLGEVNHYSHIGKFHLLDIDSTCIPSSTEGIISAGRSKPREVEIPQSLDRRKLAELNLCGNTSDFTTHIEPDWDKNAQTCLLTFRHNGRIIHRVNPRQVDIVWWREVLRSDPTNIWRPVDDPELTDESVTEILTQEMTLVSLNEFHGGKKIFPKFSDDSMAHVRSLVSALPQQGKEQCLVIPTGNLPKALTCIKLLYEGWHGDDKLHVLTIPADDEGTPEPICQAIVVALAQK